MKYYPVYNKLKTSSDWQNIYEGEIFTVFVQSKAVKQKYIQPSDDIKYYERTLFDTEIKF